MAKSILLDGEEGHIDVPLYYRVRKNKHGVRNFEILDEEDGEKAIAAKDPDVEVLRTKWRPQTWQMNNHLRKHSTSYNQATGSHEFDFQKYQDNIVSECLFEWDMVDNEGNPIPITEQNIGKLPATIVNELLVQYDKSMRYDEEQQSKS